MSKMWVIINAYIISTFYCINCPNPCIYKVTEINEKDIYKYEKTSNSSRDLKNKNKK